MPHQPEPTPQSGDDPQQFDRLEAMLSAANGDVADLLETTRHRMHTVEPQLRRFARAVADLGLPVPAEWAMHDEHEVTFSALTHKQFDAMIRLLEDIAANRPIVVTRAQAGAALFDVGPAVGPAPAPIVSSVHMSVPR